MLLSSGVVWRHRTLDDFRAECPGGDPALQSRIVEELDDALDWLESLGVEPVRRETGNPLTVGRRYDPRALTDALVRAAGDVRLGQPFARGAGPRHRRLRGAAGARARAAAAGRAVERGRRARVRARAAAPRRRRGWTSSTGARCPGPSSEDEFVRASQLYARHALVLDDEGRDLGDAAWHESDIVQRFPDGARVVRRRRRGRCVEPVRERTVADLVEAARAAGGDVRPAEQLPFELPASPKLAEPPFLAVRVYAGVTHTIGGIRIDDRARVLDGDGAPIPGLYAAGADAGGIFTGGYGSGLAAALVFGRIAAETALA